MALSVLVLPSKTRELPLIALESAPVKAEPEVTLPTAVIVPTPPTPAQLPVETQTSASALKVGIVRVLLAPAGAFATKVRSFVPFSKKRFPLALILKASARAAAELTVEKTRSAVLEA